MFYAIDREDEIGLVIAFPTYSRLRAWMAREFDPVQLEEHHVLVREALRDGRVRFEDHGYELDPTAA